MDQTPQFRNATFTRESLDTENRTLEFSAASSAPVSRYDGAESLSMDRASVDLTRLSSAAPLLLGHDQTKQIGVVERAWLEDGKLKIRAKFSRSALGEEIMQDVADGIRQNVSVGYIVNSRETTRGTKGQPDSYTVTQWMPTEVSLVPIPADNSVGVGRSAESVDTEARGMDQNPETVVAPVIAPVAVIRELEPVQKTRDSDTAEIRALLDGAGMADKSDEFLRSGGNLDSAKGIARAAFIERHAPIAPTPVTLPK